ncbi:AMP-binding protein [Epidermidibacterium keratini]|uniref:AMP-binding protein n=1 Tax=Epidermidibacterium keratini TaxID=1891644 RepID=A0A7L4YK20_9ACTN|nr:AMP-binding protein [Epidermidibacterium keratini]QHB99604.1 AMP-binding protein [Epidermidibacterium keratini]
MTAPVSPVSPEPPNAADIEWLSHAVRRFAAEQPDKPAVIEARTDDMLSWRELDEQSEVVARGLFSAGTRQGDLVSITLPNSIDFVIALIATWKAAATPQPLSTKLAPAEVQAIAEIANPTVIIGTDETAERFGLQITTLDELRRLGAEFTGNLPDLLAPSLKAPTSGGSTGRPKVIVHGTPAVADPLMPTLWLLGRDDISLVSAPMHHNAPFLATLLTLSVGGTVVLMDRFNAEAVLANIESYQCSWLYAVPIMMHRIWALPAKTRAAYDISSLRRMWHMGAPCPAWLKRNWIDWVGAETVMELYGGTEAQAATTLSGTEWLAHEGSVGTVKSGEIVIMDPEHRILPAGQTGEVWMRRLPDRDATYRYLGAEATTYDDGSAIPWETLGDIGYFDEDGYLYLEDRKSDMILVGGINVFPAEIEAALLSHPAVDSAAVIGLPDEEYGNRVHAIIHADPATKTDDILRHLDTQLSPYKRPRSIEITDQPLRDDAGKIRRSALRAQRLGQE